MLQDYGSQLPDKAQHYMERIRVGGMKMGELIDDLLEFSYLSRQSLRKSTVDTNRLVQSVLDESRSQRGGRDVEWKVGNMPTCQGDPSLLKQVWVNLLSNAIKYSRNRQPAIIEVGCTVENGDDRYFVSDNGAGFDMKYADKLFGVFQRLHRDEEFEGTGVGLAIVQRIIHRHGGTLRAVGEVDRGATFSFSLGEIKKSE